MGKNNFYFIGLVLFFVCPFTVFAQMTATPHADSYSNWESAQSNTGSRLVVSTQTPTATITLPTPLATATVTPTSTLTEDETQLKTLKDTEDQITVMTDHRADVELEFRHLARVYVEDMMREKAAAAKRAKNKKKYDEIMKQITDWDAVRQQEWDDDQALLDKKALVRKLQRDHLRRVGQKVEESLKERGLTQRLEGMEAGIKVIDQIQALDDQEVVLEKQLYTQRENYDYKGADDTRAKLKDIRAKYSDLAKQSNEKLKEIQSENPKETEQQNL